MHHYVGTRAVLVLLQMLLLAETAADQAATAAQQQQQQQQQQEEEMRRRQERVRQQDMQAKMRHLREPPWPDFHGYPELGPTDGASIDLLHSV
jgi:ABC-type protease/lipase transport system fused ATPase/permease subunit